MGDIADYFTVLEAARELGVSKSRVEQYIGDGRLKVSAVVGGIRFVSKRVVAALKKKPKLPPGRPPKGNKK